MEEKDGDAAALLGAARTAVRQGRTADAIARFERYLANRPNDDAVRREYAGVLAQAGRAQQAIEQYQQILLRRPNDAELRILLGDAHVQLRQYPQAAEQYQRALQLAPDRPEAAVKLARTFGFQNDLCKALAVYDRYLNQLRAGDEKVPRDLPALLIDLGKYEDALAFLLPMAAAQAENFDVKALLVRTYAALGDRAKAVQTLQELAALSPRTVTPRLELAAALLGSGDFELAALAYQQVLQAEPGNRLALVGTARVALRMFQLQQARGVLETLPPGTTADREYRLTWAEYHEAAGEYIEAKHIYREMLRCNEEDHATRVAFGNLLQTMGESEKAKAEYAKVPPDAQEAREARFGIAATLRAQRQFQAAIELYYRMVTENPCDGTAMAGLVRTLSRAGECEKAVALARGFVQANCRLEPVVLPVRLALGRALLESQKEAEAVQVFEAIISRPAGQLVESYYGLARALHKMGNPGRAQEALGAISTLPGGFVRNRILLADLFTTDYDDRSAAEALRGIVKGSPHNLAALTRLADAELSLARHPGRIDAVVPLTKSILAMSPTNVRGRLTLARAFSTVQDYRSAAAEYDRLIVLDPEYRVPLREKARALYADRQFSAAAAAYHRLQSPSAEQVFVNELGAFARRDPRVVPVLEPYLHGGVPGPPLQAEIAKIASTLADASLAGGLRRILLDYEARSTEQTAARLEAEAKSLLGLRNYAAIPVYQNLIALEPDNSSALFDLGQAYGALRQTQNAIPQFLQTLQVDPLNREAQIAQERASLELAPQFRPEATFFSQRGRDGLASIDRARVGGMVIWPYRDEDEYLGLGFYRARYSPTDDRPLEGNILVARGQTKALDKRLLLFGQVNAELYEDRLKDRPTFELGAGYAFSDLVRGRVRGFLENVIENGESLRQDIHRGGVEFGVDVRPTRYWTFGGLYRFASYSDNNNMSEVFLNSDYSFTLPPRQLKLVATVDYLTFAEQSIFPDGRRADEGGEDRQNQPLFGTLHPYFAPKNFVYYEARLEWWHWLSRDYFVYSNQLSYSLQYGIGFDDNLNMYNDFRALFNADVRSWLSVGVQGQALLSDVYRSSSVQLYMNLRCPF